MNNYNYSTREFVCPHCHMRYNEFTLDRYIKTQTRIKPNQPYQDVLEEYMECERCNGEIYLRDTRLSLSDSMVLSLANLKRMKERNES